MNRQPMNDARYDSVESFLDAVRAPAIIPENDSVRLSYAETEDRGHWYGAGCRTGADVQRLLSKGWTEGRRKALDAFSKLDLTALVPIDRRRKVTRADFGDSLDIGDVYAGRLATAWRIPKRRNAIGPSQYTITANMLASGGDNASVLFWRGAAAIALADLLETSGYATRLIVGFGGDCSGKRVSCRITVKEYDKPLDLATASAVLMPGFFRALGHGWTAGHHPKKISTPSMSVEQCIVEDEDLFLSHDVVDLPTAQNWLMNQVERINAASSRMEMA